MKAKESIRRAPGGSKNIYLVGEGTGETITKIARAALAQFQRERTEVKTFFMVRDDSYVSRIMKQAAEDDALVAFSIVQPDLRDFLIRDAEKRGIKAIDVIGSFIIQLSLFLKEKPLEIPGRQYILDEIGRGTSTFDGISIAWAVAEYILNALKARTLFATHYNELTELALTHDGVRNYNIAVKEWGDEIIFLRKIEKGPADKSYGIQVARLAGLPDSIIKRAKEVLANLEKEELNETGVPRFAGKKSRKGTVQLDLFSSASDSVLAELKDLDLKRITPEDALRKLTEIKKKLN